MDTTPYTSLFKTFWPETELPCRAQFHRGRESSSKQGLSKCSSCWITWASAMLGFSAEAQGQAGLLTHIGLHQTTPGRLGTNIPKGQIQQHWSKIQVAPQIADPKVVFLLFCFGVYSLSSLFSFIFIYFYLSFYSILFFSFTLLFYFILFNFFFSLFFPILSFFIHYYF